MKYGQIECPICGNVTIAENIPGTQRCMWCKRLFRFNLSIECADFDEETDERPKTEIVDD